MDLRKGSQTIQSPFKNSYRVCSPEVKTSETLLSGPPQDEYVLKLNYGDGVQPMNIGIKH